MEFIESLMAFCKYVLESLDSQDGEIRDFDPNRFANLLDKTILDGVYFRAEGLQYLTTEQYNVLRDSISGLSSLTATRMGQIKKELPDIYKTLVYVKELDNKGYKSIMYLLCPRY